MPLLRFLDRDSSICEVESDLVAVMVHYHGACHSTQILALSIRLAPPIPQGSYRNNTILLL